MPLTAEMKIAFDEICAFIISPSQRTHVLKGYAGTGKSTLTQHIVDHLPNLQKTMKLIAPTAPQYELALTSTTNKAAEVLEAITGEEVTTVDKLYSLKPQKNYQTGETISIRQTDAPVRDTIILIDEAGQITEERLQLIFDNSQNCKFLFIGDPCQTIHHEATEAPVFHKGFKTSELTVMLRTGDNPHHPIDLLSMDLRNTVLSGRWAPITVNDESICHVPREEFERMMIQDFGVGKSLVGTTKMLAWSNRRVIDYNQGINQVLKGTPTFSVGDYAIVNQFVKSGKTSIKTDSEIYIESIRESITYGLEGNVFGLKNGALFFMPNSLEAKNELLKKLAFEGNTIRAEEIDQSWIDLRAAYACTINKSQGSTYRQVYIDLDDLKNCRNYNQTARMMYVACSRPTDRIVFTGDLV